ncbi:MAG: hypothetical protein ACKVP7_13920 [Hyphomicrobiaceae bacterium]
MQEFADTAADFGRRLADRPCVSRGHSSDEVSRQRAPVSPAGDLDMPRIDHDGDGTAALGLDLAVPLPSDQVGYEAPKLAMDRGERHLALHRHGVLAGVHNL